MIVCQNVNLPHTYGHNPQKTPICDMIIIKLLSWLTNLFYLYGITMFNKYYKFHKDQKSFQSFFGVYLHFIVHNDVHYSATNIF
jgi:hypothetical protein